MINDEQKYKAYTYNIAGFALMSPFGKIVMDYISILKEVGLIMFIVNSMIAFSLFLVGLTFIEIGRRILHVREKKWN